MMRRRIAELECDLAEAGGLIGSLKDERAVLREDARMRDTDEKDLWRLVRDMEKSIQGGSDFDGVVASLLAGDVRLVCGCKFLLVCRVCQKSVACWKAGGIAQQYAGLLVCVC